MKRLGAIALLVACQSGIGCFVSVDESVLDRPDGQPDSPHTTSEAGNEEDLGDLGDGDSSASLDILSQGDLPEAGPTVCTGHKWKSSLSGTSVSLFGVWGSSASDIWAVGTAGLILHFDGSKWSKVTPAPTINTLYGVMGRSANDVWAVGSKAILHFDGTKWSPATGVTVEVTLYAVWVDPSGDEVWAVGHEGAAYHYNGTSWKSRKPSTTKTLKAVWGSGPQAVWAGGEDGELLRHNGTAWSSVSSSFSGEVVALRGLAQDAVWGVEGCNDKPKKCDGEVFLYNGKTWGKVYTTPGGERLAAVLPFDKNHLIVAGDACCDMSTCSCGRVRRYLMGKWTTESLPLLKSQPLRGLWASSPCDVWAVGYKGAIFHFSP
jgi:hypothetical protein